MFNLSSVSPVERATLQIVQQTWGLVGWRDVVRKIWNGWCPDDLAKHKITLLGLRRFGLDWLRTYEPDWGVWLHLTWAKFIYFGRM